MLSWTIAVILLAALIVLAFAYRRLKHQFRQQRKDAVGLAGQLASVQKELGEVKARRKKSLAASMEAIIIVEKDYTISSANKVARQLFGKPDKNATLMSWTRQHQLQELIDQALEHKKTPPFHLNYNGRVLKTQARSIRNEEKEVVAVALAIDDVTELQHLSRARRDFVANISHELRTPLASIQLLTDTLLKGALNDKAMAVKMIDKIAIQTEALSQLAQELLDLSMIESGQVPLKMATYSLRAIAQAQMDRLLPQAKRKNITLQNDIADDFMVLVDETMMGRVITNLIHNAIKFTEAGRVTISARKSELDELPESEEEAGEAWATVAVSDTGAGIPPDQIARIFERFYVVDRARNRQQSGTGLGLAITKHIIQAHGGHIWARNNPQTGATFYFTIPIDQLPAAEPLLPVEAAPD